MISTGVQKEIHCIVIIGILLYCYSEPMLPNSILKQGLVPKQKEDSTPKKQKGIETVSLDGHIFVE